jgi:plasmid stabilization system protein ParE
MKIEYHPFIADDFISAEIHYEELQPGLSQAFRAEVFQTIERIWERPFIYAEANGVRRALLRHFPFSIVYRILSNDTIRVLLIRHHKRHPAFGSGRQ